MYINIVINQTDNIYFIDMRYAIHNVNSVIHKSNVNRKYMTIEYCARYARIKKRKLLKTDEFYSRQDKIIIYTCIP